MQVRHLPREVSRGARTAAELGRRSEAVEAAINKRVELVRRWRRAMALGLSSLEVPGALAKIRADADSWPGVRLLIQFQTLTACRPAEARGATWAEVDPESAVWTVPANRTKTNREHRIPLSRAALHVLDRARQLTGEEGYVFQSARAPHRRRRRSGTPSCR